MSAPPANPRWRVPLRVAAIALGYIVYRVTETRHQAGSALLGAGLAIVGVVIVDRYTLGRHERLELLQVGSAILGLGLIGLGLSLVLR